jgi:hypothetical protein
MLYPGSGSKNFSIPDPDPNIFYPGSYIKRGIKNKTTGIFFLASYGSGASLIPAVEKIIHPGSIKNLSATVGSGVEPLILVF